MSKTKYFSASTSRGAFYFCGDNKELAIDHAQMLNENDTGFPLIDMATVKMEGWCDESELPDSDFNLWDNFEDKGAT